VQLGFVDFVRTDLFVEQNRRTKTQYVGPLIKIKKNSECKFGYVHLSLNYLLDNTYQLIFKNVTEF
jgi:hypothetical protein